MPSKKPKLPSAKKFSTQTIFQSRWAEFTGRIPSKSLRAPAALVSSVLTLRPVGGGGPVNPQIVLVVRKRQGKDCSKQAQIAGWYTMKLGPGQNCIGPAAVKAALDAAAMQFCWRNTGAGPVRKRAASSCSRPTSGIASVSR